MRKCNSLSLLKLFLLYATQLYGTSLLCFHILRVLRVHQFTITIHVDCNCWWLWHPLFTDKAGTIPFLTWMYPFCSSLNLIPSHCIFKKNNWINSPFCLLYHKILLSTEFIHQHGNILFLLCGKTEATSSWSSLFPFIYYFTSLIFFIEKLKRSPLHVVSNSLIAHFQ